MGALLCCKKKKSDFPSLEEKEIEPETIYINEHPKASYSEELPIPKLSNFLVD